MKYDENEQDNDDEDKDNKNTYENEAYESDDEDKKKRDAIKTTSENEYEKAAREIEKTFFGYSTKKLSKK